MLTIFNPLTYRLLSPLLLLSFQLTHVIALYSFFPFLRLPLFLLFPLSSYSRLFPWFLQPEAEIVFADSPSYQKRAVIQSNPAFWPKTFVSRSHYVHVNNVTYAIILSVYFLWSVFSLFPSSVHSPSFASHVVCIFSPQDCWTEPHKMVWDCWRSRRLGEVRRRGRRREWRRGSARGRRRQRCLI